jgi:hypothetical protein
LPAEPSKRDDKDARRKPALFIEVHSHLLPEPGRQLEHGRQLLEILQGYGYTVFCVERQETIRAITDFAYGECHFFCQ